MRFFGEVLIMAGDDDVFPDGPLSESELRAIRKIIRDDARMAWLWATLRVWAGWATAAGAAIYAVYEPAVRAIKAMVVGK